MNSKIILNTIFPNLKLVKKGKVRDIYDVGKYFLIVSTDRLSAFDVIMQQGIPYKGKVLKHRYGFQRLSSQSTRRPLPLHWRCEK